MFQRGGKERPAVPGCPQAQAWGRCSRAAAFGAPPSLRPWQCPGVLCGQWRLVTISSSSHRKGHKIDTHPVTLKLASPRCSPRQGMLCLGGTSHLFISFHWEGELMLFGTARENNTANIYSSARTPARLSLAWSIVRDESRAFSIPCTQQPGRGVGGGCTLTFNVMQRARGELGAVVLLGPGGGGPGSAGGRKGSSPILPSKSQKRGKVLGLSWSKF